MREVIRLAVSCLMLAPGVLLANTPQVVYTLTGTTNPAFGPVHAEAFQFTAPGFITSYAALSTNQLNSCTACVQSGTTVEFYPNGSIQNVISVDYIRFTDAAGAIYGYYFPPGSFSTAGTYHTSDYPPYIVSNVGTLTIQAVQTIAFDPVPNQILGVSPFVIAVRASSGLPISVLSITPTVCKNAGDLVMLLSAGTCSITASQAGNASYTAAAPVTQNFMVSLAKPSGSFITAPGNPFPVGAYPIAMVAADFNGDGVPDLAVANSDDSTVSVLLGNREGGFTAAPGSPFSAGPGPGTLVVGDFNGDGIQDLILAGFSSKSVMVLLGNGSGGFAAAPGSPFTTGLSTLSMAVGDFNGDGIPDLATANLANPSNYVTVLLGNGLGGFTAAPGNSSAIGSTPRSMAVGDFNGDGILDLAVANETSDSVTVLLGNGSGGFTPAINSPILVAFPTSVAVGDFNRDGIQDLAVASPVNGTVTVLLGNGSGEFAQAGSPVATGEGPVFVAVGDFNGDGIQDLFTANSGNNNVTLLLGNGSGGFSVARYGPFAVGIFPGPLVVADFNGDGIEDIAVVNETSQNVTVMLGSVVGSTSQTISFGPLSNVTYGVLPFTVGATASSGLAVSFASSLSSTCTMSGNTVTIAGGGACPIVASQAGNATYAAAATVTESFTVNPGPQTITFGPLSNVVYGVSPLMLYPMANSGLFVGLASTTPGVCTVPDNGPEVDIVGVGACSITATQIGDASYAAATPVSESFTAFSPCDLKQTGSISVSDLQLIVNEALGVAPVVYDLSGSGVVNVVDVQVEINAALGLGCAAK